MSNKEGKFKGSCLCIDAKYRFLIWFSTSRSILSLVSRGITFIHAGRPTWWIWLQAMTSTELMQSELVIGWVVLVLHLLLLLLPVLALSRVFPIPSLLVVAMATVMRSTCKTAEKRESFAPLCAYWTQEIHFIAFPDPFQLSGMFSFFAWFTVEITSCVDTQAILCPLDVNCGPAGRLSRFPSLCLHSVNALMAPFSWPATGTQPSSTRIVVLCQRENVLIN